MLCCALACISGTCASETRALPDFRLLVLENQLAQWKSGSTVTYAFLQEAVAFPETRNCGAMKPLDPLLVRSKVTFAKFRREAAAAFRMWEDAANISFRESRDPGQADILIGAQAEPRGRAFTNVNLKKPNASPAPVIDRSLICLNPDAPWKIGFDGNLAVYDLRYTLAHEIGHAIGLDHPGAAGQLMGYRYDELHSTLQQGDILGVRRLYGARASEPREAYQSSGGIRRQSASRDPSKPSALGLGDPSGHVTPRR